MTLLFSVLSTNDHFPKVSLNLEIWTIVVLARWRGWSRITQNRFRISSNWSYYAESVSYSVESVALRRINRFWNRYSSIFILASGHAFRRAFFLANASERAAAVVEAREGRSAGALHCPGSSADGPLAGLHWTSACSENKDFVPITWLLKKPGWRTTIKRLFTQILAFSIARSWKLSFFCPLRMFLK